MKRQNIEQIHRNIQPKNSLQQNIRKTKKHKILLIKKYQEQNKYKANNIIKIDVEKQDKNLFTCQSQYPLKKIIHQRIEQKMLEAKQLNQRLQFESMVPDFLTNIKCIHYKELVQILVQMGNTQHILDKLIHQIGNPNKLLKLMDDVDHLNLRLIDMLQHTSEINQKQDKYVSQIHKNSIVNMKQIIMNELDCQKVDRIIKIHHNEYQSEKNLGLELIAKGKVAFFILAGGNNFTYIKNIYQQNKQQYKQFIKELTELEIPSHKNLLEIILNRYHALSNLVQENLTIFIMSSYTKLPKFRQLLKTNKNKWNRLKLISIQQMSLGALDENGKILIDDNGDISIWSNGTGDIWDFLISNYQQQSDNCCNLKSMGFQYLQIIGISNILQHGFDCYMLGNIDKYQLSWGTKAVQSKISKNINNFEDCLHSETKIYLNQNKQVCICSSDQKEYPIQCGLTFTNFTIFNVDFILQAIHNVNFRNKRQFYKKQKKTQKLPPYSKQNKIYIFEKQYTDIFKLYSTANSYKIFLCESQTQFYPLLYNQAKHFDIHCCSIALSNFYKSILGIGNSDSQQLCEIDPQISLEGQNLSSVQYLIEQGIKFPLYITSEEQF